MIELIALKLTLSFSLKEHYTRAIYEHTHTQCTENGSNRWSEWQILLSSSKWRDIILHPVCLFFLVYIQMIMIDFRLVVCFKKTSQMTKLQMEMRGIKRRRKKERERERERERWKNCFVAWQAVTLSGSKVCLYSQFKGKF